MSGSCFSPATPAAATVAAEQMSPTTATAARAGMRQTLHVDVSASSILSCGRDDKQLQHHTKARHTETNALVGTEWCQRM